MWVAWGKAAGGAGMKRSWGSAAARWMSGTVQGKKKSDTEVSISLIDIISGNDGSDPLLASQEGEAGR